MTLVCNLYGGPSSGKSTTMAGVFYYLKLAGFNVEMSPEYAKVAVWEGRFSPLQCQQYVWGKQLFSLQRLMGKVDAVITDSPLLLSLFYGKKESDSWRQNVVEVHNTFNSVNFYVDRVKPYNPAGRIQTEEDARKIDTFLKELLPSHGVDFIHVTGDDIGTKHVVDKVSELLKSQA